MSGHRVLASRAHHVARLYHLALLPVAERCGALSDLYHIFGDVAARTDALADAHIDPAPFFGRARRLLDKMERRSTAGTFVRCERHVVTCLHSNLNRLCTSSAPDAAWWPKIFQYCDEIARLCNVAATWLYSCVHACHDLLLGASHHVKCPEHVSPSLALFREMALLSTRQPDVLRESLQRAAEHRSRALFFRTYEIVQSSHAVAGGTDLQLADCAARLHDHLHRCATYAVQYGARAYHVDWIDAARLQPAQRFEHAVACMLLDAGIDVRHFEVYGQSVTGCDFIAPRHRALFEVKAPQTTEIGRCVERAAQQLSASEQRVARLGGEPLNRVHAQWQRYAVMCVDAARLGELRATGAETNLARTLFESHRWHGLDALWVVPFSLRENDAAPTVALEHPFHVTPQLPIRGDASCMWQPVRWEQVRARSTIAP